MRRPRPLNNRPRYSVPAVTEAMEVQYAAWLKAAAGRHERYTPYQSLTLMEGVAIDEASLTWAEASIQTLRKVKKFR
jgi:hypothetical protein